jgi:hypothetical protein
MRSFSEIRSLLPGRARAGHAKDGSCLLKHKDAATCRIDQNVLLSKPILPPCS